MQKFILFYKGPATPPDASHAGWPEWFGKMGERLVDKGAPLFPGFVIHHDKTQSEQETRYNGYSIVQAESREELQTLLIDHPYLSLGDDYSIEVFELPA